jgi:hypothetical protein
MTLAELWRLKYVCYLEKLEEFVKRGEHCNSAVIPSFYLFLFTDLSSFFPVKSESYFA